MVHYRNTPVLALLNKMIERKESIGISWNQLELYLLLHQLLNIGPILESEFILNIDIFLF